MENFKLEMPHDIYDSYKLEIDYKESAPTFVDKNNNGKWVNYKTSDGLQEYPLFLLYLFNNSALHSRIIKSIIGQVMASGFTWDSSAANAPLLEEFFKHPNDNNETLNDILIKVITDYCIFGACSIKVDWDPQTFTKIKSIEHMDTSKIRVSPIDEYGEINSYWHSWDWRNRNCLRKLIPTFSTKSAEEKRADLIKATQKYDVESLTQLYSETSQLQYTKIYEPNSPYYAHPYYQAGINVIETDIICDQYQKKSLENGLGADYVITITGNYTKENMRKLGKAILSQHTGAKQAHKPIILFKNTDQGGYEFEKLESNVEDKLLTSINENVAQKIMEAHGITSPMIVGIKTAGSLGGAQEITDAQKLFNEQMIKPLQLIITNAFNNILKVNGFPELRIGNVNLINTPENSLMTELGDETMINISSSKFKNLISKIQFWNNKK